MLVRAAERRPLIVVFDKFDEFSVIAGVDGAAGLLRTELQHHSEQLGSCSPGRYHRP